MKTVTVLNRFGLGATPNQIADLKNPEQWLFNQLNSASTSTAHHTLSHSQTIIKELYQQRAAIKKNKSNKASLQKEIRKKTRKLYLKQSNAYFHQGVTTNTPVQERLINFWGNHFAISVDKKQVATLAYPLLEEAIRPNTFGYFYDLLLSAVMHPGMQVYLDNIFSIGNDSFVGKKRNKGLNENLAREILELHTLGVDGGYAQNDIIALANALTGWSINPIKPSNKSGGELDFFPRRHQASSQRMLGKTYADTGKEQAKSMLYDLANHPNTARHLSKKLISHFSSDTVAKKDIDTLSTAFLRSNGYLPDVYTQLFSLDIVWHPTRQKYKTPYEFLTSVARLFNFSNAPEKLVKSAIYLGQPTFNAGSPAGWPDNEAFWHTPNALYKRLQWSEKASTSYKNLRSIQHISYDALGDDISIATRQSVTNAESEQQALTVLLMSPEFQRR